MGIIKPKIFYSGFGLCIVCGTKEATSVRSVPGIAMSAAYCGSCLELGIDPLWALIATTASCGGLIHCSQWWVSLVMHNLRFQYHTVEWFDDQVDELINRMEPNDA